MHVKSYVQIISQTKRELSWVRVSLSFLVAPCQPSIFVILPDHIFWPPFHNWSTLNQGKSGRMNLYQKIVGTTIFSNSFRKGIFGGVPVALMPSALSMTFKSIKACFTRDTAKGLTLNCLFEFLSSWTMPELLTFGGSRVGPCPSVKRKGGRQSSGKTVKKKRKTQTVNPTAVALSREAHWVLYQGDILLLVGETFYDNVNWNQGAGLLWTINNTLELNH